MATVFSQMGTPRGSFDQYAQAADQRRANALAFDMGNIQKQNALQAMQDDAALREAGRNFGSDTAANTNALYQAGLVKQAQAYQKSVLDAQEAQAGIGLKKAQTVKAETDAGKAKFEIAQAKIGTGMKILQAGTSPQSVLQLLQQSVQNGLMTPEEAQKSVSDMPQDPVQFAQWRDGQLMQGMDMAKRLEIERQAAAQQETARHNKATEGQAAAALRQQMTIAQMNDARQRELNVATREDKAAAKKAENVDKEVTKYSNTLQKEGIPELEGAVSAAEGAMNRYPKGQVPGVGAVKNALPAFMMSDEGKDVRQALAQVRNIVLSARSGAAVTDQELRRLVEEIGSGAGMTEDDIRRGLQKVRDRLELIKSNTAAGVSDDVKSVYEERGGIKIQRGGAKPKPAASADPVAAALEKYK